MYKISVIIPTYNSEKTLKNTLESLLEEDEKYEIIVIDGESKDKTIEILKEYEKKFSVKNKKFIYITERDLGIYDAMNKGIGLASGKWIYFLGSDDLIVRNALNKMGKELIDESVIYYGDCYFYKQHKIYNGKYDKFRIVRGNICHQAIFYPKKVFEHIGKYDLKYKLWSDYDFNIKCFTKNYKFEYKKILIAIYNDENGASANNVDKIFIKDLPEKIIKMGRVYYLYFKISNIVALIRSEFKKRIKI